jgi:hypothetical protein
MYPWTEQVRVDSIILRSADKSRVVMEILSVIFAYFAPEVTFPLASALAASVGFIILVGRAPIRLASRAVRYASAPFRWVGNRLRYPTDRDSPL